MSDPIAAPPVARRSRWKLAVAIPVLVIVAVAPVLYPFVQQAREAARRSSCKCSLAQLGLALQNYHDAYGCFPPAYVADEEGRPLHSWRVLILPFIDEVALYDSYKFDEPWNGPNNIKLLNQMPRVYACPSHTPSSRALALLPGGFGIFACGGPVTTASGAPNKFTSYAAVLGKHCVFRGAASVTQADITDDISNTVMVGETTDVEIPWTKPEDIDIAAHPRIGDRMGFSSEHGGGANFLMAAGSVRFLKEDLPQATVDGLYTRDGGEPVTGDF